MKELFLETEMKMKDALDHFHQELKTLRTGRASLAMLDGVTVDYYGTATPLNQLAGLSVPESNLIVAQVYDPSVIASVEKAIIQADLGLNPSNDGKVVRIPVPQLTEERRKEIVKKAHDMAETARNGIRQARREGNDGLKKLEREKEISQDQEHTGFEETQKLHDHYIAEVGKSLEVKEQDILTV